MSYSRTLQHQRYRDEIIKFSTKSYCTSSQVKSFYPGYFKSNYRFELLRHFKEKQLVAIAGERLR
jgi:hypothetical protein